MIEFNVPTMSCGHCVRTITETVRTVDAQARLDIDLAAHRVQIDSLHSAEEFAKALAEKGYAPA
ncbi:heavy-metal-associated domain-containing protein [Piscinibacter sp.]|jgi:copper chaperone|uniref:heavy-metal-associated domain-containing protein n=1 Tax=Piscinibacter sp. TaxID=1903157 RepID=UPI002F42194D